MYRQELIINSPWLNAAGTLGFTPPARGMLIPETLGAFITNPISLAPRTPAADRTVQSFPGGYLLHSGHPNPGLSRVIRRYSERWAQSSIPVWVHLLAGNPTELQQMVQRLEGVEGVMAVEFGLPPGSHGAEALAMVEAAFGELPLVLSLPLTSAGEPWLEKLPSLGVSAITLSAPRGMLISEAGRPVSGRMLGPSLFPLTLAAVHSLRRIGLQVIAGAGVYRRQDAQALLDAGAFAVQLDGVLWRGWVN